MYIFGVLTQSVMRYLWSYIGKFLIDIVQAQANTPEKDLQPLLQLLLFTTLIEIVSIGGNTIIQNRVHYRFDYVRMKLVTEKNDKVLSMNYQVLEQPHILDLHQRASNATGSDWGGLGGMMNRSFIMGAMIVTMIVSATTIVVLDPRLIFVLFVAMMLNYASQRWSIHQDKIHFWDKTSLIRRKMNYLERCTQDFDYAKDIRLFSMKPWLLEKQAKELGEYERKYHKSRNFWLRHSFIYSSTSLISASVMYYILITQVLKENISIGDFTLYLGLCSAFSSALSQFYENFGYIQQDSMRTDDYRTFMDFKVDEEGEYLDIASLGSEYNFEFRNVSFRYEGAEDDTLKNLNLSFPAGQTKEDENSIIVILKKVGVYEKLASLKNGIDTTIFKHFDEEGIEPSGGEQQKLAIARALYKDAPVVILDEPTAALDPIAEYEIYRQFEDLVKGKTAIYISHRLSSCQFCDKIAVLAEGIVKEYGTHLELVNKKDGIYAEMFAAQAQYYVG
ncbi:MAG TPA: ABC transporter ATP-binding protein [Lachnospiraceae bacterium]|nr:ABC transporter ATP-binding protein [Lachnospiraceae bacterium]